MRVIPFASIEEEAIDWLDAEGIVYHLSMHFLCLFIENDLDAARFMLKWL